MYQNAIKGFIGAYSFLSNFYESKLKISIRVFSKEHPEGEICEAVFPSSEHAFHAFKVFKNWTHPQIEELAAFLAFQYYETPGKAKRAGRTIPLNVVYWNSVKNDVMKFILNLKFKDETLRNKLLSTNNAYLEETNNWHDTYWGVCNGEGENNLGKILMELREELRNV